MKNADTRTVYQSIVAAVRFFYQNGPRLVLISVLWFVCSLPVLTLGPTTLAAYTAIVTIRENGRIDTAEVRSIVSRHGLSTILLSGIPCVLGAITVIYARYYLTTSSTVSLILVVVTTYATIYSILILIPIFGSLATDHNLKNSVKLGIGWTVQNPIGSLSMGMATLFIFALTLILTIAFVVTFAGLSFSFHLETFLDDSANGRNRDHTEREVGDGAFG